MRTVLVHRDGVTRRAAAVDAAWIAPGAAERLWIDIQAPDGQDRVLLADVFRIHDLAIEDAFSAIHHPKIETYDGFLYLILHGIVPASGGSEIVTQDVDFFLGANYLITVHHETSDAIGAQIAVCERLDSALGEGPASVLHRVVDRLIDDYAPEVDRLESRLETLEQRVFDVPQQSNPLKALLDLKTEVARLRRLALPERDAIARLARREFSHISEALSYRFRDVYDDLQRLSEETMALQDRITSLLDAHLANQSNRLNAVMKVLTVIATIFMPLTVLTSLFGMNLELPRLPGDDAFQFWWVVGVMVALSAGMLWVFRRQGWL